jgi:hypothetical protein
MKNNKLKAKLVELTSQIDDKLIEVEINLNTRVIRVLPEEEARKLQLKINELERKIVQLERIILNYHELVEILKQYLNVNINPNPSGPESGEEESPYIDYLESVSDENEFEDDIDSESCE